jgi:hypothetical protein
MLKAVDYREFSKTDMIPHAIIGKPVSYFEKQGIHFVHDHDALDVFEGAGFFLDGLKFALRHYRGYPADTTTVYLPRSFGFDVDKITITVRHILAALDLSLDTLRWERKDNPEL